MSRRPGQWPAGLVIGALALAAGAALAGYAGLFGPWSREARDATLAADTVRRYCVDCHDAATASGGAVVEPAKLAAIGAHAEIWEKVVHKLRVGEMPPPNEPRAHLRLRAGRRRRGSAVRTHDHRQPREAGL